MTPGAANDDPRWCPFCNPDPQRVFLRLRHVFALWDGFPVTDGHALIVPYRHVPTWFEASHTERSELFSAIDAVCSIIRERGGIDGFNFGVNVGAAAGHLSASALVDGIEWNYRVESRRDAAGLALVRGAFEALFADPATRDLGEAWLGFICANRWLTRVGRNPLARMIELATKQKADSAIRPAASGGIRTMKRVRVPPTSSNPPYAV